MGLFKDDYMLSYWPSVRLNFEADIVSPFFDLCKKITLC